MLFGDRERIVFAGDSVTDMDRARPCGEGLFENVGHSYVRVVENLLTVFYPERLIRVTNMGWSGNTSRDLGAPFQQGVGAHPPMLDPRIRRSGKKTVRRFSTTRTYE